MLHRVGSVSCPNSLATGSSRSPTRAVWLHLSTGRWLQMSISSPDTPEAPVEDEPEDLPPHASQGDNARYSYYPNHDQQRNYHNHRQSYYSYNNGVRHQFHTDTFASAPHSHPSSRHHTPTTTAATGTTIATTSTRPNGRSASEVNERSLYVKNFPTDSHVSEDSIRDLFQRFGMSAACECRPWSTLIAAAATFIETDPVTAVATFVHLHF